MDLRNASRKEIHKQVYSKFRWQKLRAGYVAEKDFCCESCGWRKKSRNLILHHKTPIKEGGSVWSQSNLELLCRKCHFAEHGFQPWQSRKIKENQRSQWFTELNKSTGEC